MAKRAGLRADTLGQGTLFVAVAGLSFLVFLIAPWSFATKSWALLHGLCAQQPSHSFWFGVERLPFDARMTGIYGGFLCTQGFLLVRGRQRCVGLPSLPLLLLLGGFIITMGADGVNSLAADLGLGFLYQPTNMFRFITGGLAGTTMGVFLWLLAAMVLWRPETLRRERVLRGGSELLLILALVGGFGLLAASGIRWLFVPISLFLIAGALLTIFTLTLPMIQIIRRRERLASSIEDLAGASTVALLASYAIVLLLSGGRFLLEKVLDVPQL